MGLIIQSRVKSNRRWPCQWFPGPPRSVAGTGRMVQLALHVLGDLNQLFSGYGQLLVDGRLRRSLGLLPKGRTTSCLVASRSQRRLANVAVSALSRFKPHSTEYRKIAA